MNYYIANTASGTHTGPFSIDQLRSMNISPTTLVWNESMKDWTRAGDIPELKMALFNAYNAPSVAPGYNYHTNNGPVAPECPHTWLVESILATIFCCLPLGIAGIVYAAKVTGAYNSGRYQEAQKDSRLAKTFVIWSVVLSVIATIIYCVVFFTGLSTVDYGPIMID